jgi:hypothetical protein
MGDIGLRPRLAGTREIARDVAHHGIELCQRNFQPIGHRKGFSWLCWPAGRA